MFKALAGKTIERPGVSGPYFVLLAISAAVLSLCIGLLGLGVWLVLTAPFLVKAAGLLSIGLALVFRPRLGSVRKVLAEVDPLTETDAPALFGLVRRVATAIGAPMPHTLARSLLVQPARTAFGTAAELIDPADLIHTIREAARANGYDRGEGIAARRGTSPTIWRPKPQDRWRR